LAQKGLRFHLEARLARISVSLVDENGDHLRYVARTEARKMVSTGEAVEVCRNCERAAKKYCGAHGKTHAIAFQVTALHRNTHNSPCQLTAGEMLANVGLSMRDEANHGISLGRERAAQSKIEAWPMPE
jgi:hypothetical protein